jgi:hypothetical protein
MTPGAQLVLFACRIGGKWVCLAKPLPALERQRISRPAWLHRPGRHYRLLICASDSGLSASSKTFGSHQMAICPPTLQRQPSRGFSLQSCSLMNFLWLRLQCLARRLTSFQS